MKYIRSISNPSSVGVIPDALEIPVTHLEISKDEYLRIRAQNIEEPLSNLVVENIV